MESKHPARSFAFLGLLLISAPVLSQAMKSGDHFRLQLQRHSEDRDAGNGVQSSSDDTDTLTQRVVSVASNEIEVEFDLPAAATARDRLVGWQFPARVRYGPDGSKTLLNTTELAKRRDAFLQASKLDQSACGHWIFTWNAFKIECDPQSAIGIIEAFEIQPDLLADGAPFAMKGAAGSAAMTCVPVKPAGKKCSVLLDLDADEVRRELADTDIVTGEILGKPVTPDVAAKRHAATQISGTIDVTFEADAGGLVWKRTTVLHSKQVDPAGHVRVLSSTAVLTRARLEPTIGLN